MWVCWSGVALAVYCSSSAASLHGGVSSETLILIQRGAFSLQQGSAIFLLPVEEKMEVWIWQLQPSSHPLLPHCAG